MPVQWLEQYGEAAGYISTILGLMALILVKPIKRWVHKRKEAKEKAAEGASGVPQGAAGQSGGDHRGLGRASDDIGDLQYERLSQAQDFYTSRGMWPGPKREDAMQDARILPG